MASSTTERIAEKPRSAAAGQSPAHRESTSAGHAPSAESAFVQDPADGAALELSIVMPCLNEAETLEVCVRKARGFLERSGVRGEVIIADNGSTDGSQQIATAAGARVVPVSRRGYGAALMGGFEAARGRYLIMGDADDSYDFENLMPFVERLRAGYDVVMGNRFRGGVAKGAMPWHHYWIGNPILTGVLNLFYRSGIGDAHCGLRGLTRQAYEALRLRTTGMEFASEMVVKAAARRMKMCEVPTTLKPDGRSRPPHLRSFRDGWRHLRFLMLLSPLWTLVLPGFALACLGLCLGIIVGSGPAHIGSVTFDVHTLIAASLMMIVGYQAVTVGFAARIYALTEEIGPPNRPWLTHLFRYANLERCAIAGGCVALAGLALLLWLVARWRGVGFGPLPINETLRPMVIGVTLVSLGLQTVLSSFFYSMLGIQRKGS